MRKQGGRRLMLYGREHFTAHGMEFETVQHLRNSWFWSRALKVRRLHHRHCVSFSFAELGLAVESARKPLWGAARLE
jgi:hypothetical protein